MSTIWTKPIPGPKAWRGGELAGATSWMVTLAPAEIADIERALATAKASGRPLAELEREHFPLERMRSTLQDALDEIYDGHGFVLVRGLDAARYSDDDLGTIFWGLGRYLGTPLYQNPRGELLGHVYDHGRTYCNIDVRGYESNAYLPYHTDNCDVVGLLCARRALEGGLSSIVSAVSVHNDILTTHPEYLGLLYNGFYYIRREEALTNNGVSEQPIPVFGARDGVLSCPRLRRQPRPRPPHPAADRDGADVGGDGQVPESAMLVRGTDTFKNFDDEPHPDAEFSDTALANWKRVVDARAKRLFSDGRLAPSEAYGSRRAAT